MQDAGEKLQIDGGIKISSAVASSAGTIQWTGTDFEGHDGTEWISLTNPTLDTNKLVVTDSNGKVSVSTGIRHLGPSFGAPDRLSNIDLSGVTHYGQGAGTIASKFSSGNVLINTGQNDAALCIGSTLTNVYVQPVTLRLRGGSSTNSAATQKCGIGFNINNSSGTSGLLSTYR